MKIAFTALSFVVGFAALAAETPKPKVATPCDLLRDPMSYAGKVVDVTGVIHDEFESSGIACTEKSVKHDGLGIWIDWDMKSIEAKSPTFAATLRDGFARAARWKGGLRGTMRFRGLFEVSTEFLDPESKVRFGFGHIGMFGYRLVVLEVLEYRPNKAPEPTITAGTSAAELPRVPAAIVAHL